MDIYLMEVFNTSCPRASLQALDKLQCMLILIPSELCLHQRVGTPSLCVVLGHLDFPNSPSTSGLPQEVSLTKLETQSVHVAELKYKVKFPNALFFACKSQFISIRESVKKSIFLKE